MGIVEFLKEEKFLMDDALKGYLKEQKRDAYGLLERARTIVLYGLRGTGKTTLLAQKYSEVGEKKLAIHGEHLNLAGYKIKDLIPDLKYVLPEGYLFFDEITKLRNWAEEIKILSDLYPKVRIIVTGSSAVNLQDARRILSRRALFVHLKPLAFNEFLRMRYAKEVTFFDPFVQDPLTNALRSEMDFRDKIQADPENVLATYKKENLPYLMNSPKSTLLDVLDRVIFEDIGATSVFSEDVLPRFWPLIKLLALSEKTSYDNLAIDLGLGKGTVIKMVEYLSRANVVRSVLPYSGGKGKVRKEPKYLFASPTIRETVLNMLGERTRAIGLTREDLFAMHAEEIYYLKTGPDYVWNDCFFEIGGASKGARQFDAIPHSKKKFIVHEGVDISSSDDVLKVPFYIFLVHK